MLREFPHRFYSSYKVGKKGLSLWKELLPGRAGTCRSQLCGSEAQATGPAVSTGTSAPCPLPAWSVPFSSCTAQDHSRTSRHHPLMGKGTAHHGPNCSLKVSLSQNPTPMQQDCKSHPFSCCLHQALKLHEPILLLTDHPGSRQERRPHELTPSCSGGRLGSLSSPPLAETHQHVHSGH